MIVTGITGWIKFVGDKGLGSAQYEKSDWMSTKPTGVEHSRISEVDHHPSVWMYLLWLDWRGDV